MTEISSLVSKVLNANYTFFFNTKVLSEVNVTSLSFLRVNIPVKLFFSEFHELSTTSNIGLQ